MNRFLFTLLALFLLAAPAAAQQATCASAALIAPGEHGNPLVDIDTHESPGFGTQVSGTLTAGDTFQVLPDSQPQCIDDTRWYQIISMSAYGWIPETIGGETLFIQYVFTPEAPVPFNVPLQNPVITTFEHPLPTVTPAVNPETLDVPFAHWDWNAILGDSYYQASDPLALQMPTQYAGDLPVPPVDLSSIYFLQDANLNDAQLALLAQNGFVVVPSTYQQFDDVYGDYQAWDHQTGKADFVTTDALFHALFVVYQNTLMFLETSSFYGDVASFLKQGYQTAEQQYREVAGTPLEASARKAAVYYAVPLMLLAEGEEYYVQGYEQTPVFNEGNPPPSSVIAQADPEIIAEAQPLVDLIKAGEGRQPVPILEDYEEDFSQYIPRSYYAGSPLLESYFRAMMWLGRITFTAQSRDDTETGLLVLRALYKSPIGYESWHHVADTLDFLVGPVDDYGPNDYLPMALKVNAFGEDFSLGWFRDPDRVFYFQLNTSELPPPRINSIPIPQGALSPDQLVEQTRGFRLFGQRFTFDGYIMQQLIYPEVGTATHSRTLPLGLDVPASFGSDMAFALTDQAGATSYENYTENVAALREEVNGITGNDWLQNLYGGWLFALQPLANRDSATTPPMMQTDAWVSKDLNTYLGSLTELKHATLLYAEQPVGGLGGGGMEPPVISYGYVEPNPLAFARIAIVSGLLREGLAERGYLDNDAASFGALYTVGNVLRSLAGLSAQLAEMARKEIAGEPLTHDELYFLQESFAKSLWYIRYEIEMWLTNPPESVAIIADVASNPASGEAREMAIGSPDLIYVITNSPYGLQVTRGAVYTTYEFTVPIDDRMTDDEWRQQLSDGTNPPLADWTSIYRSE